MLKIESVGYRKNIMRSIKMLRMIWFKVCSSDVPKKMAMSVSYSMLSNSMD